MSQQQVDDRVRKALLSDEVVEAVARIPWDSDFPGAWDKGIDPESDEDRDPRPSARADVRSCLEAALKFLPSTPALVEEKPTLAAEFRKQAEEYERKRAKCKEDEAADQASGKLGVSTRLETYQATWNYYEGIAKGYEWAARAVEEAQPPASDLHVREGLLKLAEDERWTSENTQDDNLSHRAYGRYTAYKYAAELLASNQPPDQVRELGERLLGEEAVRKGAAVLSLKLPGGGAIDPFKQARAVLTAALNEATGHSEEEK